jgi:hypothetical protein
MAVIQRVLSCNNQKIKAFVSSTLHTGAAADRIVTSANMKVGSYTVAAQPYCPSLITVATTAVGTADTQGTITITGTDIFGITRTDTIIPVAGSTVTGTIYFKTITSVVGAGWVIDVGDGNDTIVVGVPASGGLYTRGLPVTVGIITGNVWINPTTTAVANTTSLPFIAGDLIENLVVPGNTALSLISDGSGGTFYAIVWEV